MKLIYFISGLGVGGAERQVCDLADQLSEIGHEIIIVSLTGEALFLPQNSSIPIIELRIGRSFLCSIKACIKINKLIRTFKPDVVHCHMFHAILFVRLLRIFIPIPILISTSHCVNEFSKYRMMAYRFTDRLNNLTTNVSEIARTVFIKKRAWPANKSIVMYNGINTDRFHFNKEARIAKRKELGIDEQNIVLLAVGRIVKEKDYPNLLKAFAVCNKERQNLQLLIIGSGNLFNELQTQTAELGIAEKVFFLGQKKDVDQWMSAADLFVLSSEFEGFGLVTAEAMATGLPVVSTNCGAVTKILENHGTIVPIKNEIALANAILATLSNLKTEGLDKKILVAREYIINNYSISFVANRWVELYESFTNR